MGSLPMQPPGPQPSPMGVPSPVYPAPGLMPYKTSVPAQLMSGLSDFMQSFVASRRMTQSMAKDKFFEGLQMRTLGIPTYSDDQMAKFAKKAGFDYNFDDVRTQEEEQQYQQQMSQQKVNQANMAGVPMQPGPVPGGNVGQLPNSVPGVQSPSMMVPQPTPQPGPAAPPMGIMGRIKNALGLSQPTPQDTAAMSSWLGRLGSAVQAGGGYVGDVGRQGEMASLSHGFQTQFKVPLEKMSASQQMQAIGMASKAMNGDTNSMEMMARVSNGWQLPSDTFVRVMSMANPQMPMSEVRQKAANLMMYTQMGGKDYNMWLMNYAKDLAPHFGDNPFAAMHFLLDPSNSPGPAMSADEWAKASEGLKPWLDRYPTMTPGMATGLMSSYTMSGGDKYRGAIIKELQSVDSKGNPRYPTSEAIKLQLQSGELGVNQMNAGTRLAEVNDLIGYHHGLNDIARINAIREALNTQDKQLWDMVMSGKASYPQEQEFNNMIARNNNTLASIPVKLGDGTVTHMASPVDVIGSFRGNWLSNITSPIRGVGPVITPRGGMGMPMGGGQPGPGGMPDRVTEGFTNILRQFARMPSEERPMMLEQAKSMMDPQMYKLLVDRVSNLPTAEPQMGGGPTSLQMPAGVTQP